MRIPRGQVVVDIPLNGLRVGDRVLTTGRLAAAERTARVCRPLVQRVLQLGGRGPHPASAVASSVLV
ncbi:hypothetical protein AB0C86_04990 [Streptomyces lavendulae]|uniref:hypothetical protein n=1 Tax=Streptomyces lavendulae TaxID=1914 RepID=UPI00340956E3